MTEPTDTATTPDDAETTDPDTFDRDYVHGLREEAKANRERAEDEHTRATEAVQRGDTLFQQLRSRTVEVATRDLLRDPSDLKFTDDQIMGEDGFPSVEKVRALAEQLAADKPYLARPSGTGNPMQQGAKESTPAPASLGQIIRAVSRA